MCKGHEFTYLMCDVLTYAKKVLSLDGSYFKRCFRLPEYLAPCTRLSIIISQEFLVEIRDQILRISDPHSPRWTRE